MADIHQQHQAAQGQALAQVVFQQQPPVAANGIRHLGVAIAGQIHQIAFRLYLEKIEQLGSARRFANPGELPLAGQDIEGAGLAGVGAAGEGHFPARIGRQLRQGIDAVQETGSPIAEGGCTDCWDRSKVVRVFH